MARPKAFDETEALEAAMDCFWDRGYEATSVRDLTQRMGIASPSLYNAFGDKRALFSRSLEYYCAELTRERIRRIEVETSPKQRITRFLGEVVERSMDDPLRRGCFLINSAIEVAPHDPTLATVINGHLSEVRDFFARTLTAAKSAGQVAAAFNPEMSADHVMAVLLGIRVLARTGASRAQLEGIVAATLAAMSLPPLPAHHG